MCAVTAAPDAQATPHSDAASGARESVSHPRKTRKRKPTVHGHRNKPQRIDAICRSQYYAGQSDSLDHLPTRRI